MHHRNQLREIPLGWSAAGVHSLGQHCENIPNKEYEATRNTEVHILSVIPKHLKPSLSPSPVFSHHRDSVYSVDFQHKDRALDGSIAADPVVFATGSKDRTIAVWDTFGDTYKERRYG